MLFALVLVDVMTNSVPQPQTFVLSEAKVAVTLSEMIGCFMKLFPV